MAERLMESRTTLRGEPDLVRAVLVAARERGRLVALHGDVEATRDGLVQLDVTLLTPRPTLAQAAQTAAGRVVRAPATWVTLGGLVAVGGVVAGVVWLVEAAVRWCEHHPLDVALAVVVLVLVLIGLARLALGGGVHCPGCRG